MKIKSWDITLRDVPSTISNSRLGAFDGNTVQPTENDEFFTTDTEAFLVFNLLDEDFHPTSATITLHNSTDGSVVNEDVPVANGVIEYEMRHEVIEHAGAWQAQLVYEQEKDGVPEKYTSKVVGFNVAGHLLDTKEPVLVVIENWDNFVLTAEGTMERWKSLEAVRQENENQRVAAETARQEAYDDLIDTGVMQENINQKLAESEAEYAPRLTELEQNDAELTAQLAQKPSQLDSLIVMKDYNAELGEVLETSGYYEKGDGGGGTYVVGTSGTPDGGLYVELTNGLIAKLVHGGAIYAKQYGVKLDNVTDDTERLNVFFKRMGHERLIVNDGVARTTSTLFIKGKWRADQWNNNPNNSTPKLIFDNATIRYDGIENECIVYFYHHFQSLIEGFTISRLGNFGYVDFSMCWHMDFRNFDVLEMRFDYRPELVADDVGIHFDSSVHSCHFSNGFIVNGNLKMYSTDTNYINHVQFTNVNFFADESDYAVEFYGKRYFENISFYRCDMSYMKKSIFYFDETHNQHNNSKIILDTCYLDSGVPYAEKNNFKGFNIDTINVIEASSTSNTKQMAKIEDYMSSTRISSYGPTGNNIPSTALNFAKNGDLSLARTDVYGEKQWIVPENTNPKFLKNNSSPSGNSLELTFPPNSTEIVYLYSVPLPISSRFTFSIRFIKKSGSGRIQLGVAGTYTHIILDDFDVGQELVLTGNGMRGSSGEKGKSTVASLNMTSNVETVIEIVEIVVSLGSYVQFFKPLHKTADLTKSGLNYERPLNPDVGQFYFDTSLKKTIWYSGSDWVEATGVKV